MIERSVVLVLGAGASSTYKLPLGLHLLRLAVVNRPQELRDALEKVDPALLLHLESFRENLRRSGRTSIDAFLEARPEFEPIGKAIIAYHLIGYEDPEELFRLDIEDNWMQYLMEMMLTHGFDGFIRNKLSILTYNYDRSLECYMYNALESGYGKSPEECKAALKQIPIVHLHGQIGALPEIDGAGRKYERRVDPDRLRIAMQGIRIVYEPIDELPAFDRAHDLLCGADIVIFLGFGYLPINVQRLELGRNRTPKTLYFGTGLKMTDSERRMKVQPLFPKHQRTHDRIQIARRTQNVYDFLRNNQELFIRSR